MSTTWSLRAALTRAYLTADPRSLGLARVVLGAVLLLDLARRGAELTTWYSNAGVLPNHTVLWQPVAPRLFSLFFMVSLPHEAVLAFLIAGFCFFAFMIGWRTRLFHVLSLLFTISLHTRVAYADGVGSVALGLLCLWTLFLPMGRRFSVDAVLASLRARRETSPQDLGPDRPAYVAATSVVSLAVLCLLLQLAAIYALQYAQQSGPTWRSGAAVHYLLHQDRIVTALGLWVRQSLSFSVTHALTVGILAIQAAAPILLLLPIGWVWSRRLAIVVLSALHVVLALLVNSGIFAAAMLAYLPLLLSAEDWRWLSARANAEPRRTRRQRTVFFDVDCGVCFQVVRVLARVDVARRLHWVGNDDHAALPPGVDVALLDRTILVVDPVTGRRWTRADAFAEILGALPLGRLVAWTLRVPLLRRLAGAGYDRFAAHRTRISVWLGLAACGVPIPSPSPTSRAAHAAPPAGVTSWLRARRPLLRELLVVLVLAVVASDVLASNPAAARRLRLPQPLWMQTLVMYPGLSQRWSLFAPDAPTTDQMVYVDATTVEGRHVDPYNRAASRVHALPIVEIPTRLGQSDLWAEYTRRIPSTGVYHQALLEWVQRLPEWTGRRGDRVAAFEAWVVTDVSPPPGEQRPRDVQKRSFFRWPR